MYGERQFRAVGLDTASRSDLEEEARDAMLVTGNT